jgi:pyrimidine-nucleoside phosphorylase
VSIVELIERKRDGGTLSAAEIEWIIASYVAEEVADYQMSALLMAIFWRGFDDAELAAWTGAMLHSGEVLDFTDLASPKLDKHSTGGVGDKVSIPLAPMVAACGIAVPMMSGRGLGHTGGTLDKLESIAGFTTQLDPPEFRRVLGEHGLVLAGQSATLVPADRLIYALRDATGTVASIPLISSSIMSKKLAEGLDALVLDVKVGRGAFMRDEASARKLAGTMVGIGRSHNTEVVAILTAMEEPLGRAVGNANEIAESVAVLRGGGPADLVEVTYRLGEEMLLLAGLADNAAAARSRLEHVVASGEAFAKFLAVTETQGGDTAMLEDTALLPQPDHETALPASRAGYVTKCDALAVGRAGVRLGAGRARKEDPVDPAVGFTIDAKVGDRVDEGDPLVTIGWNDPSRLASAMELLTTAWEIGDEPPQQQPLIIGEVR